jgi:hypothetical protein
VDITTINPQSLRKHVGIVAQEPVLFSGTVDENIRAFRTDIPAAIDGLSTAFTCCSACFCLLCSAGQSLLSYLCFLLGSGGCSML